MGLARSAVRLVNATADRVGLEVRALGDGRGVSGVQILRRATPTSLRGRISTFTVEGTEITFFSENDFDLIQKHHVAGEFYEPEELEILRRHFTGGTFFDVGANVGNHSVFAAKILKANRIVAFEPNKRAFDILRINLLLNGISDRSIAYDVGLAGAEGRASINVPRYNLGEARLSLDATAGGIRLVTGDSIPDNADPIGMIKIDTEGFEMDVLSGLQKTIAKHRPPIFIEVDHKNEDAFRDFVASSAYGIAEEFTRYKTSKNYMLVPT